MNMHSCVPVFLSARLHSFTCSWCCGVPASLAVRVVQILNVSCLTRCHARNPVEPIDVAGFACLRPTVVDHADDAADADADADVDGFSLALVDVVFLRN